ncbi:transcription antitermination factor NusB [Isachenkonia alkalipeptolytica]|uniref:Transcription antitermination protein NusB n=1 Tax=Isachenkonia alkalipeptolytica TaxID=2565777 RepID=A0AA44BF30_9CLOT|nr:transcription antitermination factor NusB [Isachenkonia alkalipeptolytica]NBG88785.1 transcription antitermination factor NusB [Isachenkonia alkalipeptolytica]
MSRRSARELCMKILYEMEIKKEFDRKVLMTNEEYKVIKTEEDLYMENVIDHFINNQRIVDEILESHLTDWKLNRISKVDLSILRVATVEILFIPEIDSNVSINEAIEITKSYSEDKSAKYINGVLDSIATEKQSS